MDGMFCQAPFTTFEIRTGGGVGCCCWIFSEMVIGNVFHQDLESIWNGSKAQDFRASILDGSFRHCKKDRCVLLMKNLLPKAQDITDPRLREIIDGNKVVLDRPPLDFTVSHDPTCNLACPSCRIGVFGANAGQVAQLRKVTDQVVLPALDTRKVERLWLSGNGDPWASTEYRRILRHIADNDCGDLYLLIHTNAQLLTPARWAEYQALERYRPHVRVSMDAVWPWTYHRLRRPGRWEKLAANLGFISQLRQADKVRLFEVNMTVQADNYQQLPTFIALAKALGCDQATLWMIYNSGPWLSRDFNDKYVADPAHPEYRAFLEVLRNPVFDDPLCSLLDIAQWRDLALGSDSIAAPLYQAKGGTPEAEDFVAEADGMVGGGDISGALAMVTAGLQVHQTGGLYRVLGYLLAVIDAPDRAADALYTACDLAGSPPDYLNDLSQALGKAGRQEEKVRIDGLLAAA